MADDKCILDPQRDCIGKAAAVKLEARVETLERWQTESQKFHSAFYDWQRNQIARDARLDEKLGAMETNLSKLVTWKEEEKAKPGKRWDGLVDKAIWAICAAVIAYLLAQVGL